VSVTPTVQALFAWGILGLFAASAPRARMPAVAGLVAVGALALSLLVASRVYRAKPGFDAEREAALFVWTERMADGDGPILVADIQPVSEKAYLLPDPVARAQGIRTLGEDWYSALPREFYEDTLPARRADWERLHRMGVTHIVAIGAANPVRRLRACRQAASRAVVLRPGGPVDGSRQPGMERPRPRLPAHRPADGDAGSGRRHQSGPRRAREPVLAVALGGGAVRAAVAQTALTDGPPGRSGRSERPPRCTHSPAPRGLSMPSQGVSKNSIAESFGFSTPGSDVMVRAPSVTVTWNTCTTAVLPPTPW